MVQLFGGAIEASIPSAWRDVSQVRQVPDNQEVYQDCEEETGTVLVVEILERQGDVEDSDACSFFLGDLADANDTPPEDRIVNPSRIVDLRKEAGRSLFPKISLPATSTTTQSSSSAVACISRGSQRVARGEKKNGCSANDNNNEDCNPTTTMQAATPRWIDVEMFVLRLESVETDLLITLSVPRRRTTGENNEDDDSGGVERCGESGGDVDAVGRYSDAFESILASFDIKDWSLFG